MTRPQTPRNEDLGLVGIIAVCLIVLCMVGVLVLGCLHRPQAQPPRLTPVTDPMFRDKAP